MPQLAFAAQRLEWKTHGLIALLLSTVGAIVLVKRNKDIQSTMGSIMGFGLYFWVIMFTLAIIYGALYALLR